MSGPVPRRARTMRPSSICHSRNLSRMEMRKTDWFRATRVAAHTLFAASTPDCRHSWSGTQGFSCFRRCRHLLVGWAGLPVNFLFAGKLAGSWSLSAIRLTNQKEGFCLFLSFWAEGALYSAGAGAGAGRWMQDSVVQVSPGCMYRHWERLTPVGSEAPQDSPKPQGRLTLGIVSPWT